MYHAPQGGLGSLVNCEGSAIRSKLQTCQSPSRGIQIMKVGTIKVNKFGDSVSCD